MNWIGTTEFEEEYALTFKKRYKDTGDWLLAEPVFKSGFMIPILACSGVMANVICLLIIIPLFLLISTSWSGKDGSCVCAPILHPWILALLIRISDQEFLNISMKNMQ